MVEIAVVDEGLAERQGGGMAEFGERVRAVRLERGLSVRELATKVGISFSYLSNLELQGTKPSEQTVRAFARELALDEDELLQAAGIVPEDLRKMLCEKPGVFELVRALCSSG